jgi:NADH-quinone oxidoreductase subunit M
MEMIYLILVLFLGGALLTWLLGKISPVIRDILFISSVIIPTVLFFLNVDVGNYLSFQVLGYKLSWGISYLAYLFSYIVLGLGSLASIYAVAAMKGKKNLGFFYSNFILSIMSMMGILLSRDLISFFIFWEIMTWSSYLMVVFRGKDVQKVGIKYFVFSAIGAYAMLMAIVIVNSLTNSLLISDLVSSFGSFSLSMKWLIPLLLLIGFAVKSAMMPLHVWAPGAYSNSPMAFTSMFSGALSKMGVYGMIIVMVSLVSYIPNGFWLKETIAWLGGITAVGGTLWAVAQDDAKKLLAYSSVAQLGYIIVGIGIGTPLAMLAALFMAVMHAIFKGNLFLVVGAIERQTGTSKLTEVSGLIRKMPWTFISALLSIIALAGIPPLGGFVGKWMLYESLIGSNHYLLVIVVFFSSTAAFLYSYKFLFGFFLGQEEKEWSHIKEAPAMMVVPMMILAIATFVLGTFPGLVLNPIDNGLQELGFASTQGKYWEMSALFNEWGNQIMLQPLVYAIIAVFLFFAAFLTIKGFKHTRYVTTKDISSSGEVPKEHENLTFSQNFFQPFLRAVEPFMKRRIDTYYSGIGNGLEAIFDFTRRIYTGNGQTYALYAVIFIVVLLMFKNALFGL